MNRGNFRVLTYDSLFLWCLIKACRESEATHGYGYERVGVRAELSWRDDGAAWFVLKFSPLSVDLVFCYIEMFPLKSVYLFCCIFFSLSFLSFKYHPSIDNRIGVSESAFELKVRVRLSKKKILFEISVLR
jgi:hypothetical protein